MNEPVQLTLRAGFDRQLVRIRHRSVRYLVVEATAPRIEERRETPPSPLNLGLIIDASGSMSGADLLTGGIQLSRLEAAKQAGAGVVQQLGERDCLSLVSFADEALTHLARLPLDAAGKREAVAAIAALETRGSTNLHEGWLAGAEQVALHLQTHPECRSRLLLLSDGHANQGVVDPGVLAEVASGLRVRGISTSTVGIGADYSSEQIEGIAEHGGGILHHAQNPGEIVEVVLAELRDMRATCIDNLEVSVGLVGPGAGSSEGGVTVEVVGLASRPQPSGACAVMGSLVGGATRRAVFRVFVPEGPAGQVLHFRIEANWKAAGSEERQTEELQAVLTRAGDKEVFPEITDQALGLEAARVWQAAVVRQAVLLNGQERYQEASRYVGKQLKYFRRFCDRLSAGAELVAGLEETMNRIIRPIEHHVRKELAVSMFQTRVSVVDARCSSPIPWRDHLKE